MRNFEKTNNRQKENAYIIYMMTSSLFNKCTCISETYTKTLFLYYKEMKIHAQVSMEEKVLGHLNRLTLGYTDTLASMNCVAKIVPTQDTIELWFTTGFETLHASVEKNGHYTIEFSSYDNESSAAA